MSNQIIFFLGLVKQNRGAASYSLLLDPQGKKDAQGIFNGFINTFRAGYIGKDTFKWIF